MAYVAFVVFHGYEVDSSCDISWVGLFGTGGAVTSTFTPSQSYFLLMCGWRVWFSFLAAFWSLACVVDDFLARLTFAQLSFLALLPQKVFVQASLKCLQLALFSDFEGESVPDRGVLVGEVVSGPIWCIAGCVLVRVRDVVLASAGLSRGVSVDLCY